MKTTEQFYAVQVTGAVTKKPRLALGVHAGPNLFYWHRPAVAFKRGLAAEGFKDARVVKVRIACTW